MKSLSVVSVWVAGSKSLAPPLPPLRKGGKGSRALQGAERQWRATLGEKQRGAIPGERPWQAPLVERQQGAIPISPPCEGGVRGGGRGTITRLGCPPGEAAVPGQK